MDPQKIKIIVDKNACIGVASCVQIAGQVFQLASDGRVMLVKGDKLSEYEGVTYETLLEAAKSCPTQAIKIVDEATGKTLFPN